VSAIAITELTVELQRAAEWTRVVRARDDVYEIVSQTAGACMGSDACIVLDEELALERQMLAEISGIFDRMAEESREQTLPLLDALLDQIATHGNM
jgi:hypothetical protein